MGVKIRAFILENNQANANKIDIIERIQNMIFDIS